MQGFSIVSFEPDVKYRVVSWVQIYCLILIFIFNYLYSCTGSIIEEFSSSVLTTPREGNMNPLVGGDFSSDKSKLKLKTISEG